MIDVPIQVKDALREGRLRKNYRFQVLNDDGTVDFTIDNDNLVSESVNIDERMCSGDKIKYGLCEGSSLEFQYFGKENITGRQLKVFVDVEYEDESAYTYTDVEEFPRFDAITITTPGHYKVYSAVEGVSFEVYLTRGTQGTNYESVPTADGAEIVLGDLMVGDILELTWGSMFWTAPMLQMGTAVPYAIPMGYFTVKNCSRQASTGIIKATAYNKLMSDYLDAKANSIIEEIAGDHLDGSTSLYTIIKETLGNYGITEKPKRAVPITSTSYPSPSSVIFDTVSMKIVGSSTTYYAAIGNDEGCYVNINTEFSRGTMITFTALSDFIEVMRGIVAEIKNTIFTDVQNSATVWSNLINAGLGNYISMAVSFYDSQYIYFYTLSEILRTPEYNQRAIEGITNLYNVRTLSFRIADKFGGARNGQMEAVLWSTQYILPESLFVNKIFASEAGEFNNAELISVDVKALPDVTLRELQSAVFETVCQFGQLNRETDLFSGVELNRSRLLPADTLYPDNALYPNGAQESAFRSQYSKLWADEGNVRKWRYLIITYKGLNGDGQEEDFTLQRTVNADGTDDYNCSDNWLFRNLIWTAADIGTYADAMVLKMRDITWFPFEMWCAGLPYLETGDEIEIPLGTETYTSYILQRQLKGIQNLQDTYINGTLDIF